MTTDLNNILTSIGARSFEVGIYGIVDECAGPIAIVAVTREPGQERGVENSRSELSNQRTACTYSRKGSGAYWRGQCRNRVSRERHPATQTRMLLKAKRKRSF